MSEPRTLEQLRDEYDTTQLLEAVDALDQIRNILADGPNLEPPQVRDDLLRLHTIVHRVVNEGYSLSDDPDDNPGQLASELELRIDDIAEAADNIQAALSELIRLCPDQDELEDEEDS